MLNANAFERLPTGFGCIVSGLWAGFRHHLEKKVVLSGKSIYLDLQGITDRAAVQRRDNVTFLMTKIPKPVPVSADRTVRLDEPASVVVDRLLSGKEPSAARTIGPKGDYASTMTSAADWPPGPRDWEASFSQRWLRLSHPRPCWPGIVGGLRRN